MSMSERTQVLLTPAQRAKAQRIAAREGKSVGAVLRDALDSYEGAGLDERRDAVQTLLGLGAPTGEWQDLKAEILASRAESGRA